MVILPIFFHIKFCTNSTREARARLPILFEHKYFQKISCKFGLLFFWVVTSFSVKSESVPSGLDPCSWQCCGTGNAGTATFCHSGTGTVMYYGSGSGCGNGFGSRSNIMEYKSKKNRKCWGNHQWKNAAPIIEKARFCIKKMCCWKAVLNNFGSGTGTETFPESQPEPQ